MFGERQSLWRFAPLMKKKIPSFKSDVAAKRFVSRADLTRDDLSEPQAGPLFEKKSAQLNMRLPKPLLDAAKRRAKERGITYTRFFWELIEQGISMPLR
jgi:predicted DNA binding CopG/RHH family protein